MEEDMKYLKQQKIEEKNRLLYRKTEKVMK